MSERIDDLEIGGFKIIQDTALFCYGMDAVLLCAFAQAGAKDKCLDLCTGNGIVPLLMYAKGKGIDWTAVELQSQCAKLAQKNMVFNKVDRYIEIIEGNICDVPKGEIYISKRDNEHKIIKTVKKMGGKNSAESTFSKENSSYDAISNTVRDSICCSVRDKFNVTTCNPPYMKVDTGFKNPEGALAIARHEIECDFADVAKACAYALKLKGRAYFVHRPKHLISILGELRQAHLEPKRVRFVHSYRDTQATLVLIEAIKGGGEQLIVESPLIVYESEGVYTKELLELYGKL